jgi:hypothetical protein
MQGGGQGNWADWNSPHDVADGDHSFRCGGLDHPSKSATSHCSDDDDVGDGSRAFSLVVLALAGCFVGFLLAGQLEIASATFVGLLSGSLLGWAARRLAR